MIQVSIAKHAVAFPSKVLARDGGKHIYNIQLAEAASAYVDNGWFVGKGEFVELDLYKAAAPTSFEGKVVGKANNGNFYVEVVTPGDAMFVYQVPMIEETYSNTFKKESNYTNAPTQVVRAYELAVGDVVEISADGFDGTIATGDSVELKAITGVTAAKRLAKKTASQSSGD